MPYIRCIDDAFPNVFPKGKWKEIVSTDLSIAKFGKEHRYVVVGDDMNLYPIGPLFSNGRFVHFELRQTIPTDDDIFDETKF